MTQDNKANSLERLYERYLPRKSIHCSRLLENGVNVQLNLAPLDLSYAASVTLTPEINGWTVWVNHAARPYGTHQFSDPAALVTFLDDLTLTSHTEFTL